MLNLTVLDRRRKKSRNLLLNLAAGDMGFDSATRTTSTDSMDCELVSSSSSSSFFARRVAAASAHAEGVTRHTPFAGPRSASAGRLTSVPSESSSASSPPGVATAVDPDRPMRHSPTGMNTAPSSSQSGPISSPISMMGKHFEGALSTDRTEGAALPPPFVRPELTAVMAMRAVLPLVDELDEGWSARALPLPSPTWWYPWWPVSTDRMVLMGGRGGKWVLVELEARTECIGAVLWRFPIVGVPIELVVFRRPDMAGLASMESWCSCWNCCCPA
mmetsp:Transcript_40969/g.87279  ORF Transcript_40969/g.87279 Transcript_40969/m.87279 type:complete len:274 (-) Transcript_40969:2175-2996(-)